MGNQRSIHTTFWTSTSLSKISPSCRLFLAWTMTGPRSNMAGYFKLSFDDCQDETGLSREELEAAIKEGADREFIVFDAANRYLWVKKRIEKEFPRNEISSLQRLGIQSILEASPKTDLLFSLCERYLHLGSPFEALYVRVGETLGKRVKGKGSRNPTEAGRGKQEEGSREQEEGSRKGGPGLNGFPEFWSRYPRKEGIGKAEEAWMRHVKSVPLAEILEGITRWEHSEKWREGFIPMPATWLNQKRWRDTPLVKSKQSAAQQLWDQAQREKETSE